MLDVFFPHLQHGDGGPYSQELQSGRNVSKRSAAHARSARRGSGVSPLFSSRGQDVDLGEYQRLLGKELKLHTLSPHWQNFRPHRLRIRLSNDWPDVFVEALKISTRLFFSLPSVGKSDRNEMRERLSCELIVPSEAPAVSPKLFRESCSYLTISDTSSTTSMQVWSSWRDALAEMESKPPVGVELFGGLESEDSSGLRRQVKIVSLLRPTYIRMLIGARSRSFLAERSRSKGIALIIEAFSTLSYEPVAVYPDLLVFSADLLLDWSRLGLPSKVLGLGVGAVSRRFDGSKRVINSANPNQYAHYRAHVNGRWKERELLAKAHRLPYLHQAIEQDLVFGEGINSARLRKEFGFDLETVHPGLVRILKEAGLVEEKNGRIKILESAKKQATEIARNFFLAESDISALH